MVRGADRLSRYEGAQKRKIKKKKNYCPGSTKYAPLAKRDCNRIVSRDRKMLVTFMSLAHTAVLKPPKRISKDTIVKLLNANTKCG